MPVPLAFFLAGAFSVLYMFATLLTISDGRFKSCRLALFIAFVFLLGCWVWVGLSTLQPTEILGHYTLQISESVGEDGLVVQAVSLKNGKLVNLNERFSASVPKDCEVEVTEFKSVYYGIDWLERPEFKIKRME